MHSGPLGQGPAPPHHPNPNPLIIVDKINFGETLVLVHIPDTIPNKYKTTRGDTIKGTQGNPCLAETVVSSRNFHGNLMQCCTEGVLMNEIV